MPSVQGIDAPKPRFGRSFRIVVSLALVLGLCPIGEMAYAEELEPEDSDITAASVEAPEEEVVESTEDAGALLEEALSEDVAVGEGNPGGYEDADFKEEDVTPDDVIAYEEEEAIVPSEEIAEDALDAQAYNAWTGTLSEGVWSSFRLNDSELSTGSYSKGIASFTLAHRSNVSLVTMYQPTNVGSGSFSISVVEVSGKFSGQLANRSLSNSSKTVLTSPISDNKVAPKSIPAGRYLVTYTYRNTHNWKGAVDFEVKFDINPLFEDVPRTNWARDVIADAVDRGHLAGYDASFFGTNDPITRGQVATVLWNMARKPSAGAGKRFTDVASGQYYAAAIAWASSNGIVSGYGDGTFRPDARVTRQELAAMIANYARFRGASMTGFTSASYAGMSDAAQVASYARGSMGWCFAHGVLSGSQGRINPNGAATRAETAKMVVKVAGLV